MIFSAGVQAATSYDEQFQQLFTLGMNQLKQVRGNLKICWHISFYLIFSTVVDRICTFILVCWKMCPLKSILNVCLPCFGQLINVQFLSPFFLFQMLPLETNIKEAYQAGTDDEQNFIQNLSLFLCTFLKEHAQLIEKKTDCHALLMEVLWFIFMTWLLICIVKLWC